MQEKTCPICNETYHKFIDYCFRDGAKLVFPGEEVEVEDTEQLSQVHKIQYDDNAGSDGNVEEDTASIGLNIVKPNIAKATETIDEDLEGPMALGNTQMLRKEDLLAMFHDDSTYNGELIESEEEIAAFEADETEDMEATETFDLTNRQYEEKTEFEKSTSPLPIIDDVTPVVPPVRREVPLEPVNTTPPSAPSPQRHTDDEIRAEKEPSVSPLLLMGGLLGLVFAVVGFFFFYQNQANNVPVIAPPPQKKVSTTQQQAEPKPQEPIIQQEPPALEEEPDQVEEDLQEAPQEEKVEDEELIDSKSALEPESQEDISKTVQLGVKLGPLKIVPISITELIQEKDLVEKLIEIGVDFKEGETTAVTFVNTESMEQVVEFPLSKDETFLGLSVWKEGDD